MKRWLIGAPLLAWWVVAGVHFPPRLVAGPSDEHAVCQTYAQQLNRIELTFRYDCQVYE